jgi:hypothetical protein
MTPQPSTTPIRQAAPSLRVIPCRSCRADVVSTDGTDFVFTDAHLRYEHGKLHAVCHACGSVTRLRWQIFLRCTSENDSP